VVIGAAPFGEMPSSAEVLRRARALLPDAARHERNQHVVSKVVLKQFTEPWGAKGELLLAALSMRHPEKKILRGGPARFGKIPDYLRFASSSAEDLWAETETRLDEPLKAVWRDGQITDARDEAIIRDAIALHVIRSIPTAALHQVTWMRYRKAARQWRGRPEMVEWMHASRFGWWTSDPARLELALDEFYRPVDDLVGSHAIFRVSLEDRFERLRSGFRAFELKILTASDSEFLIGDVPVLLLRDGRGGLGFFDGIGLANADEIVFPLTPRHVAVLGQGSRNRTVARAEVERYNALQVGVAYRQVYFRIGSGLHGFARSVKNTTPGQAGRQDEGASQHLPEAAARVHQAG
jgi:hypothetical protein